MKNRPLYENLNTSFVNLPALINFLRRARFIGSVKVKFRGYEAEVFLSERSNLQARENDRARGRIAEGADVLPRILLRARAPGGVINVYQDISQSKIEAQIREFSAGEIVSEESLATATRSHEPQSARSKSGAANRKEAHLPFELSNQVETKARQMLSEEEFETLLSLAGELLDAVDRALAAAQLDFPAAFHQACAEITADYPFLGALVYGAGKIHTTQPTRAKIFAAALLEALRRTLEKLNENPSHAEACRDATQKILALLHNRRADYDRFHFTPKLQKILGI